MYSLKFFILILYILMILKSKKVVYDYTFLMLWILNKIKNIKIICKIIKKSKNRIINNIFDILILLILQYFINL